MNPPKIVLQKMFKKLWLSKCRNFFCLSVFQDNYIDYIDIDIDLLREDMSHFLQNTYPKKLKDVSLLPYQKGKRMGSCIASHLHEQMLSVIGSFIAVCSAYLTEE